MKSGKKDFDYEDLNSDYSDVDELEENRQHNQKLNEANEDNGVKELMDRNKFLRR